MKITSRRSALTNRVSTTTKNDARNANGVPTSEPNCSRNTDASRSKRRSNSVVQRKHAKSLHRFAIKSAI